MSGSTQSGRSHLRPQAVVCPFKGLAAFESSDAEFFCGRDRIVSELIARLAEWPLVGILGPSGIGKSSLLRAGVLPALRAGALPGSAGWRQVLVRPGKHPSSELERALGGDPDRAVAELGQGERIVVAVDQLEDLFTVCEDDFLRREFLERLVALAGDHERRVLVLCTLRADFYGRLSVYPRFAELLSRSHALVGPMARAELREAIEQPAARAGLEVEDGLVEVLLTEVADEPGSLPLLSTTMLELWQARDGRRAPSAGLPRAPEACAAGWRGSRNRPTRGCPRANSEWPGTCCCGLPTSARARRSDGWCRCRR